MKTYKHCSILILALYIITTPVFAISIRDNAGTTTGEFLRIGVGARAISMGEAYAAVADDVYALYWNPAGLMKAQSKQVLLTHTVWYEEVNHEYAGCVYPINPEWGSAGVSIMYLGTTFEKRSGDTEAPDSYGDVADMAVGASYANNFLWGIQVGLTLKYIHSKLDVYSASTYAMDAGLQRSFLKNKLILLAKI